MHVKKIMCCCGQGLGSSFLVEMNVKQALKNLNISGVDVSHGAVGEIFPGCADVFVVGNDIVDAVSSYGDVIALRNIVSVDEVQEKLKEYLSEKGDL